MILVTLKSDLDVQQTPMFNKLISEVEAGLVNKSSSLAPALCATKFTNGGAMILVTLCCAD